jgi:nitrogen fixation NifU-like protein
MALRYTDTVMARFNNGQPKNGGMIKNADGVGQVGNARCGDIMKIYLSIKNGKITDAKFKTFGCVSAIASTDMACDMIKGKTLDEALQLSNQDVVNALGGLPEIKIHCSVLAKEAIEEAIANYRKKQAQAKKK